MDRTKDINFVVKGLDGVELKCSLTPLKQKIAGKVFHTCVSQLVSAIASAIDGQSFSNFEKEKMFAQMAKDFSKIDYELLWEVASELCRDAVINNKEISSLDEVDELADYPWLLYLIIFNGIKGNWPRVFSSLGAKLNGFGSQLRDKLKIVTED